MLGRLADSKHRPGLVVTRPNRRRGRGRRLAAPPVADVALGLGIEVAQPEDVNSEEARSSIAAAAPDEVVICAFGGLIREPLLSSHPMLNVHPSLLPRWRGAAPIERAIDAGDFETGVSIMRPVTEMDAGPVCLARPEPIRPDDDFGSLSGRLERLGGDLLVEALNTRPGCRGQPHEGVTIAHKISAADRRLDPARPASVLERRVRALAPHVVAYVELPGGGMLQVLRARARPSDASPDGPGAVGELRAVEDGLRLACADGELELLVVKPAGGKVMDAGAYARGREAAATVPPRATPQSEGR